MLQRFFLTDPLSPNELLYRLVFVLFKHKWLVCATFVFTMTAILTGWYLIDPEYKATVKILVRHNPQQQLILFKDLETPGLPSHQINPAYNLVELSTSRGMAEIVVKKFGLDQPKEPVEFRHHVKDWAKKIIRSPFTLLENLGLLEEDPSTDLSDAIDELIDDVQDIKVQRDTEIIGLNIWGPSPELSADIANSMAELLVERTRSITQSQAAEAYEFTKEQVSMAEESLREAEERVIALKVKENIVSLEEELELILKRLDSLRNARTNTIAELREAQAQLLEFRRQLDGLEPMVVSTSVVAANPVTKELKASQYGLSGKLAALKIERSKMHPEVKELQAQIAELESRIAKESPMVLESETSMLNPIWQDMVHQVANLKSTVAALQAKVQVWTQELDAMEDVAIALSRNESILERLTRDKQTYEKRFKTLKTKLLELEVQRLTRSGQFNIEVVDEARVLPNAEPDYPDLKVFAFVGFGLSVLLAFGIPFVREYINDSFDMPRDVEKALALPVLGTIPVYRRREPAVRQYATNEGGVRDA